jgi:hypothetical protein
LWSWRSRVRDPSSARFFALRYQPAAVDAAGGFSCPQGRVARVRIWYSCPNNPGCLGVSIICCLTSHTELELKKISLILAILSALANSCCEASPIPNINAVHRQLVANYALISQYFATGNLAGISALTAPGYVALAPGERPVDRQDMLNDFKAQMKMMKDPIWSRQIGKLSVGPGRALAIVYGHMTATTVDQHGKQHAFVLNALTADTWILIGTKWEVLHSQVLRVSAFMDGRRLQARP